MRPGFGPPPPGPFRPTFWRSPLRGPRLTALLGLVLLIGLPVVILTGLLSNDAYQPGLGGNGLGRDTGGPLDFYLFGWPTGAPWLYGLTQGLHVTVGLALTPIVLAKLWSVLPRLFEWPPFRSPAHALERATLALLVGGVLFEFITGILNIQYWYVFRFDFVQAHYYGAWVFIGAFVAHVTLKLGPMRTALRTREETFAAAGAGDAGAAGVAGGAGSAAGAAVTGVAGVAGVTEVAAAMGMPLRAPSPGPMTMSRRALLAGVGAASALLGLEGAGQSIGGPLRPLALLLPRGRTRPGPLGFPVNKSWAASGLKPARVGAGWRLEVHGARTVSLSRSQLLALPQRTVELPIACVEGWTTTQTWTGVALRDLAALCGVPGPARLTSQSLERGTYGHATLGHEQVADSDALLALRVNGADLPLDHGYPARVIAPAVPGVHCTKWVSTMAFVAERT